MVPNLFFYQLAVVALVGLCVMLHWVWPSDRATVQPTPPQSMPPRRKRRYAPKPFAGLTKKPHCDACEPTFKGVWHATGNFAPLPLLHTRPDQCPQLHR